MSLCGGECAVGRVEKSKLLKNILGHVDPVVIHKIRDFPPNRFIL